MKALKSHTNAAGLRQWRTIWHPSSIPFRELDPVLARALFFGVNGCPVLSSHGVDVDANVDATSRYHGELHDADSEIHHQAGTMDSSFLESN